MERDFDCGVEGEAEQGNLLSKLPRHIIQYIFVKLPLQSICRARLVCKEWNSVLSSSSFISSLPEYNPWLLFCAEEYCMAYCFSTEKWMKISLSFLPPPIIKDISVYKYSSPELGLVLRESPHIRLLTPTFYGAKSVLYVCNPLTNGYAEIESDVTEWIIGIVQGERVGEPYLVAYLDYPYDLKSFSIQVYHYFQDSWRIKSKIAEQNDFEINPGTMVAFNGFLFFRAQWPVVIAGYNIRDDFIKPVRVAAFPRHIVGDDNTHQLFMLAYGLSILVIAMTEDSSKAMIILELFQDDKDELLWKWREFATMPSTFLPSYFQIHDGHFIVVGDYLCNTRRKGESGEGVAYNLKEGFWQCLPEFPDFDCSMISSFQPKPKLKGGKSSLCTSFC